LGSVSSHVWLFWLCRATWWCFAAICINAGADNGSAVTADANTDMPIVVSTPTTIAVNFMAVLQGFVWSGRGNLHEAAALPNWQTRLSDAATSAEPAAALII
jgi:hypothetical protein